MCYSEGIIPSLLQVHTQPKHRKILGNVEMSTRVYVLNREHSLDEDFIYYNNAVSQQKIILNTLKYRMKTKINLFSHHFLTIYFLTHWV